MSKDKNKKLKLSEWILQKVENQESCLKKMSNNEDSIAVRMPWVRQNDKSCHDWYEQWQIIFVSFLSSTVLKYLTFLCLIN